MDAKLLSVINDIKERTGIDITVYDMLGERLASTSPEGMSVFPQAPAEKFDDGIYSDAKNDLTCFLFSTPFNIYTGVIGGSGATSKNYAYMISSMLENALSKNDEELSRQECLKQLLTGETARLKIQKLVRKFPSLNLPCYVLSIVCPSDKAGEVVNFLEQLAGDSNDTVLPAENDMVTYLRCIEGETDYQSALDFAEMVLENIEQEISVKVNIGVGSYSANAYELAGAYFQSSNAVRMGMLPGGKGSIFSYKEFIMVRMIEEIPKSTLNKYLDLLLDSNAKDILGDGEMMNTAAEFLANSLNVSETSRKLYMHRNTLMYRLDKIEKAMGLNIRHFSDAVTFRIIQILYKHLKY